MTIDYDYNRAEWLYSSTPPITGPAWVGTYIQYFNIHWTGSTGSVASSSEVAVLNGIQNDYVNKRGYSFGYSSAVGLSGNSYEGRGTTYRAASNGDSSDIDDDLPNNPQLLDNLEVFGCLLVMGIPDKISTPMLEKVRSLYVSVCASLGRHLEINGHNDLDHTGCPGPQAQEYVDNGIFYPIPKDSNDMETLRTPRRIIDTRQGGGPVNGSRSFDLKSSTPNLIDAEVTVTTIPDVATAGYAGVTKNDSFCNWVSSQYKVPIPQTLSVPVNSQKITLFWSVPCHVIIDVRAEG